MRAAPLILVALAAFLASACEKREKGPTSNANANATTHANATTNATATASADAPPPKVVIPNVIIHETGTTVVHVAWKLPAGTGVNDGAPFRVQWTSSEGLAHAPEEMRAKGADVSAGFDVAVTPTTGAPSALLAGNVDVVVCDVATHRVCVPVKRRIEMTFLAEGKTPRAEVTVPLPEARPQG